MCFERDVRLREHDLKLKRELLTKLSPWKGTFDLYDVGAVREMGKLAGCRREAIHKFSRK